MCSRTLLWCTRHRDLSARQSRWARAQPLCGSKDGTIKSREQSMPAGATATAEMGSTVETAACDRSRRRVVDPQTESRYRAATRLLSLNRINSRPAGEPFSLRLSPALLGLRQRVIQLSALTTDRMHVEGPHPSESCTIITAEVIAHRQDGVSLRSVSFERLARDN